METKKLIRKRALACRDGMTQEELRKKSRLIMERLTGMEPYAGAEILLTYRNWKSEVITVDFIGQALKEGKRVYCPAVNGEEMEFYRIDSESELIQGYRGIPEPVVQADRLLTQEEILSHRCLAVVPGSAFDRDRNRIGYGKGYYDRYLGRHPSIQTVAVCFDCQLVEKVPAQLHDRKPDMLLTETYFFTR